MDKDAHGKGTPKTSLGSELEAMLEKEVGLLGKHILRKQCQDMGVRLDEIKPIHLNPLATRITKAIIPMTGEKRAADIRKGILEYVNALETVEKPSAGPEKGSTSAEAEITIAEKKLSIGHFSEAEASARRALDNLRGEGDSIEVLTRLKATRLLARVLSARREGHAEAQAMYERAISLAEKVKDKYETALSLNGLGSLAWRTGEHRRALDFYTRALRTMAGAQTVSKGEKTRLDNTKATIHSGLGNVYLDLVDMRAAIEHNEQALLIFRNMENWSEAGRVYNNLARVYEEMREFPKAIDCYERGIQFCKKGMASRMEGWTLTNLASALIDSGKVEDAKKPLERAERILAEFPDPVARSKLNCMWGKYHREKGEWQHGIERFERSIAVIADQNAPDYTATAQEEFGTLYQKKGDKENAAELLKAALEWQKKKGDRYRIEKISLQLKELGVR